MNSQRYLPVPTGKSRSVDEDSKDCHLHLMATHEDRTKNGGDPVLTLPPQEKISKSMPRTLFLQSNNPILNFIHWSYLKTTVVDKNSGGQKVLSAMKLPYGFHPLNS